MSKIVLNGFGPHVRFKTTSNSIPNRDKATVKVVVKDTVKTVHLSDKVTDLSFKAA